MSFFVIYNHFNLLKVHIWLATYYLFEFIIVVVGLNYHFSFFYFFIICYYCKLRIRMLTDCIKNIRGVHIFFYSRILLKVIRELNKTILDIDCYNQFWKRYISLVYYILTPINLALLNITISNDWILIAKMMAGVVFITTLIIGLIFNLFISSINEMFNEFYKNSQNIYLKYNSVLSLRQKFKLIIIFFCYSIKIIKIKVILQIDEK